MYTLYMAASHRQKTLKKDLRLAEILATFANASPRQIDRFHQKYPVFLPYSWWDTPVSPTFDARLLWSPNQIGALVAGRTNEFEQLGPTMEPSDEPWMLWRVAQFWVRCLWEEAATEEHEYWITTKLLSAAWDAVIHSGPTISTQTKFSESQKLLGSYVSRLFETPASASFKTILEHPIPIGCADFQAAVTFLAHELWRARKCRQCGARFVAAHQGKKFCPRPLDPTRRRPCSDEYKDAAAAKKREQLAEDIKKGKLEAIAWAEKEKKRKRLWWRDNRGKEPAVQSKSKR